jgi:prophage regulatory protein
MEIRTQKFIRLRDVMSSTGLSRSTIYELMAKDAFPKQIHLTPKSVAWSAEEVLAWQKAKLAARDVAV